ELRVFEPALKGVERPSRGGKEVSAAVLRGGIRMRALYLFLAIAFAVAGIAQPSEAIARLKLMSCKDLESADLGSQGRGLVPISCAKEFSATDPYVVLIIDVQNVDFETGVITEIL